MKDFIDRQPTKAGRRKITYEDGTSEFVTVEMADEPTVEGTLLNRETFMAIQGFEAADVVFNENGSIVETNVKGESVTTTFPEDGSVCETFRNVDGLTITKRTLFNEDGSISMVIEE